MVVPVLPHAPCILLLLGIPIGQVFIYVGISLTHLLSSVLHVPNEPRNFVTLGGFCLFFQKFGIFLQLIMFPDFHAVLGPLEFLQHDLLINPYILWVLVEDHFFILWARDIRLDAHEGGASPLLLAHRGHILAPDCLRIFVEAEHIILIELVWGFSILVAHILLFQIISVS